MGRRLQGGLWLKLHRGQRRRKVLLRICHHPVVLSYPEMSLHPRSPALCSGKAKGHGRCCQRSVHRTKPLGGHLRSPSSSGEGQVAFPPKVGRSHCFHAAVLLSLVILAGSLPLGLTAKYKPLNILQVQVHKSVARPRRDPRALASMWEPV